MGQTILIQGAMNIETEFLISKLTECKELNLNGYRFYKGIINQNEVIVSITKVGMLNCAVATILAINHFKPDIIINQGVARGHSNEVHRGDIVIGENVVNMNSYLTEAELLGHGMDPGNWKLITFKEGDDTENEKISADIKLVKIFEQKLNSNIIHIGTIASGDCWNKEVDRIKWFVDKIDSKCEDMETYAAYKVSNDNKVPVIGIRIISNSQINQEKYDKTLAIKLQKELYKIL